MTPDEARKELAAYRLKQAREALADARTLADHGGSLRSIINRCYYAMFYAALAVLCTIGRSSSKHAGVIALFDQSFVKTGVLPVELSKSLHRGFELRQLADYEAAVEVREEEAGAMLLQAEAFVAAVGSLLSADYPPVT